MAPTSGGRCVGYLITFVTCAASSWSSHVDPTQRPLHPKPVATLGRRLVLGRHSPLGGARLSSPERQSAPYRSLLVSSGDPLYRPASSASPTSSAGRTSSPSTSRGL